MTSTTNRKYYEETARNLSDGSKKYESREQGMHLDHIVPVSFGWEYNIPAEVISLPENLEYVPAKMNLSKGRMLTEKSIAILNKWVEDGTIENCEQIMFFLEGNRKSKEIEYDFTQMHDDLKKNGIAFIHDLPSDVAYSFLPVFCQRAHELRWGKTKRAIGIYPLPTHRMMICAVYPDGTIVRLDGNTRTYIFKNNLQFPDYEAPSDWYVTFIPVKDEEEAERIYHSIDSTDTAETFAEKISGYMKAKKYHFNLPTQFQKGEKVYDIAVVAVDGYVPAGEFEPITINPTKDMAEKARQTVDRLDYFIGEFAQLGGIINNDRIPRSLSSPIMGVLIRYLMVDKSKACVDVVDKIVETCEEGWYAFRRPSKSNVVLENILIMLDELRTPESINWSDNPLVPYRKGTSRAVLPENATKTTSNVSDRRLYCGWVMHCIDKCIAGEKVDEDVMLELSGDKITNNSNFLEINNARSKAKSYLMKTYDNFWNTHKK
jgi:hypothetical protein